MRLVLAFVTRAHKVSPSLFSLRLSFATSLSQMKAQPFFRFGKCHPLLINLWIFLLLLLLF